MAAPLAGADASTAFYNFTYYVVREGMYQSYVLPRQRLMKLKPHDGF